jgi:acyl-CoA thioesterase FadM
VNHLFRFAWMLLTFWLRPKIEDTTRSSVLKMRVWPTDLDPLMHMNNGVYLSLLDLGRIDLMLRSGAFFKINRQGIYPVVASEVIRFRRSLTPLQKFEIHTRIAAWDDRYFYLRQDFRVRGDIYAEALVKGRFLKRSGGKVAPSELLQSLKLKVESVPQYLAAERLQALEDELGN